MIVLAAWLLVAATLVRPYLTFLRQNARTGVLTALPFALAVSVFWPIAAFMLLRKAYLRALTNG